MEKNQGIFCISLDTEFFWGVHDTLDVSTYGERIFNAKHCVIDKLLSIFNEYGIHATWVVVGAILAKNYEDLFRFLPEENKRPTYENEKRSSYRLFQNFGKDRKYDDLFFGRDEIFKILDTPNQEMGTHTFSHYYCCERGQTTEQFEADIEAAIKIGQASGISFNSIVFPKNEMSAAHMQVCAEKGIKTYRGIEENWIYQVKWTKLHKALRFVDSYINLSGSNVHEPRYQNGMLNIAGSRIFRPYMHKLAFLESFKIRRIKGQMKAAAKNGGVFHLWWHPHNFGKDVDKNMSHLDEILKYYLKLKEKYDFQTLNMGEIYELYGEVDERI